MNIKKTLGYYSCNNKIFSLKCLVGKKAKRILVFSFSLFQTNKALISTVSIFFIFFVANLNWKIMLDLAKCHSMHTSMLHVTCSLIKKTCWVFYTEFSWMCLANKESGSCLDEGSLHDNLIWARSIWTLKNIFYYMTASSVGKLNGILCSRLASYTVRWVCLAAWDFLLSFCEKKMIFSGLKKTNSILSFGQAALTFSLPKDTSSSS